MLERDLNIFKTSCKKVKEWCELQFLSFSLKGWEKYYDEGDAFMKHNKWGKERNENKVAKLALENERRKWILKSRNMRECKISNKALKEIKKQEEEVKIRWRR